MTTIRRVRVCHLIIAIVVVCVLAVGRPAGATATTVFTFDVPGDASQPYLSSLPVTFSQDGITLDASAVTGSSPSPSSSFKHTNVFSVLFPHISEGALTDGFLLTQISGWPPSTLTLAFSAEIVAFSADFGVSVDFNVVANPTPASLRLEAFAGSHKVGGLVVTPTGGPDVYEGVVSFSSPAGAEPFDRVVLTALPAAFDAGSPEFIVDNVRVTPIAEPSVLVLGVLGLLVLTGRGLKTRMREGAYNRRP
jgi:hypothetical protein